VFDRSALANEVREYVVTDKIEDELKRIVDTFTQVSETLRRGGPARDVMGMWISGFFGSGKSHFAKVLGYLLQNDELGSDGERCIDAFVKHLSDSPRGKDVRLRLGDGCRARTGLRSAERSVFCRTVVLSASGSGRSNRMTRRAKYVLAFLVAATLAGCGREKHSNRSVRPNIVSERHLARNCHHSGQSSRSERPATFEW
jgi:hypothetical protein